MIDGELGGFLRSRREQLSPIDVGLPVGPRRRTPGLRRAEVATLSGISVEYLTRIEQGRDTNPSAQVLTALAGTLRLDEADMAHLQQLATIGQGTGLCARELDSVTRAVRPAVHAVLDSLEPAPAYVINRRTDLLAWNDGFDRLARPLGLLEAEAPNLVWFSFTDQRARTAYPDWADVALDQVSFLHAQRHGDPATDALAERLAQAAGPEFRELWQRKPLTGRNADVTNIEHPQVGSLRLTFESLELSDRAYRQLVICLPADATTARSLDRLAGRTPGALRAVSG